MKHIETMKLALEALENAKANFGDWWDDEITALREALAEQPAQQEPVAWMTKTGSVWKTKADETDTPLYTSPPAQRKPLTDEEIEQVFKETAGYGGDDFISFARAIEAAHGIKENT